MGNVLYSSEEEEEGVGDTTRQLDEQSLRTARKYGLPTSHAEYEPVVTDALQHGWRIEPRASGCPELTPPEHFPRDLTAWIGVIIEYNGARIAVPDIVFEQNLRRTGSEASERTRLVPVQGRTVL